MSMTSQPTRTTDTYRPPPVIVRCSICDDERKAEFVAGLHIAGYTLTAMAEQSATVFDPPVKRDTIGRHIKGCLATKGFEVRRPNASQVRTSATLARRTAGLGREDVATLVQRDVVAKLKSGEARVTVQHGLQAQSLIDRREERQQDRQLAITLARLLFTGEVPEEAVLLRVEAGDQDEVIEGEFEDLDE